MCVFVAMLCVCICGSHIVVWCFNVLLFVCLCSCAAVCVSFVCVCLGPCIVVLCDVVPGVCYCWFCGLFCVVRVVCVETALLCCALCCCWLCVCVRLRAFFVGLLCASCNHIEVLCVQRSVVCACACLYVVVLQELLFVCDLVTGLWFCVVCCHVLCVLLCVVCCVWLLLLRCLCASFCDV